MFHIYVNRETIKGGACPPVTEGSFSYTCPPLYPYIHLCSIHTSVPLSFMISMCMCICQDGETRVGHAHTTCSAARCAATSVSATVHASPARRSPDTVSNRGVVAACASQISSFILSHGGGKREHVGASSEEGQCGASTSEAPHQTDTSCICLPATSFLHLFTCFLQTTSYVSPE